MLQEKQYHFFISLNPNTSIFNSPQKNLLNSFCGRTFVSKYHSYYISTDMENTTHKEETHKTLFARMRQRLKERKRRVMRLIELKRLRRIRKKTVPGYTYCKNCVNPEKPDVPLNKNDAFQKVQKRRVQEKRWARSHSAWSKPTVFLSLEPSLNGFKISFKSHCRFKIISYLYAIVRLLYLTPHPASCTASCLYI